MKTVSTITLLVLLTVGSAMAGDDVIRPGGPLELAFGPDGACSIVNQSAEPFVFDGYSLKSAAGLLDNAAWKPIPVSVSEGLLDPAAIGMSMLDAFKWAEMSNTPSLVCEAHLSALATLPAGGSIPLGAPLGDVHYLPMQTADPANADLSFTYVDSTTSGGSYGEYYVVPEPASLGLLALGGLGLLRRRR